MIDLIQGDALQVIRALPCEPIFGGVITDPPYSSGGMTMQTKTQSTATKYTATKGGCPFPDFEGDAKDQRSWTSWMAEWMSEARRRCLPGAPIVVFIDWRQLPSLSDAMQWAGWIWRGVTVWDKVTARPQKGRFRQQAEFIVWGSNGPMPVDRNAPVLPGVFSYPMPASGKRRHQTEKPLQLMRDLVKICEPGVRILDPFAGSGTTLVAADLEGYDVTGVELTDAYYGIAKARLQERSAAAE